MPSIFRIGFAFAFIGFCFGLLLFVLTFQWLMIPIFTTLAVFCWFIIFGVLVILGESDLFRK